MKSNRNTLLQVVKAFIIVIALTFSTNMNASTQLSSGGSWYSFIRSFFGGNRDRDGGRNHRHFRGCGHNGSSQGGGDSIPIDGGLSFLLVGAAAFGVKKLRENKNEKNQIITQQYTVTNQAFFRKSLFAFCCLETYLQFFLVRFAGCR